MLEEIVTSQLFVVLFLVWPFIYLTFIAVYIGKISKPHFNPVINNIMRTTLVYSLVHLILVIYTLILGKEFYSDLFFHPNAPIIWTCIAASLLINLYIDFFSSHGIHRHMVVIAITFMIGALYVFVITPLFISISQYLTSLITDLTNISPK